MNLDDAQRKKVSEWIAQGLKLSEIQNKLSSEFGLRLTYMDVRLLVDDLKLVPMDPELPKVPEVKAPADAATMPPVGEPKTVDLQPEPEPAVGGKVNVTVDQLARPGAIVSGQVTFSDGNTASWQLDQTGRLGIIAKTPGYRPPPADVPQFQAALEAELSKMGF